MSTQNAMYFFNSVLRLAFGSPATGPRNHNDRSASIASSAVAAANEVLGQPTAIAIKIVITAAAAAGIGKRKPGPPLGLAAGANRPPRQRAPRPRCPWR